MSLNARIAKLTGHRGQMVYSVPTGEFTKNGKEKTKNIFTLAEGVHPSELTKEDTLSAALLDDATKLATSTETIATGNAGGVVKEKLKLTAKDAFALFREDFELEASKGENEETSKGENRKKNKKGERDAIIDNAQKEPVA